MSPWVLPRGRVIALGAAAALLVACGEQPVSSRGWDGVARDSAGVRIVENGDEGVWPGRAASVEEELSIGRMDGGGPEELGNVVDLAVDEAGRIFVLDAHAQEVRVFDASGAHLRSFGRPGSGPGELSPTVAAVFVAPDGAVSVPDVGNARVTRYTTEGVLEGSWPLRLEEGVPVWWDALSEGSLVAQLRSIPGDGASAAAGGSSGDPVVRYDGQGHPLDTLAVLPPGGSVTFGAGGAPVIRLFEAEPIWDAAADGAIAWAMNTEYSVNLGTEPNRAALVVRRASLPRPVTRQDEAGLRRMVRDLMLEQGVAPAAVETVVREAIIAPRFPIVAAVRLLSGGELWVQRVHVPTELGAEGGATLDPRDLGSHEWDVFGADGRYHGVIPFPEGFLLMDVVGDRAYGVARDELGVQRVVRLRVESPTS